MEAIPTSMRAAVLVGPGDLRVEDRPVPIPGPGEILVKVRCAGICGTDLAVWRGRYRVDLPLVPGHEFCGDVVARGKGVEEAWEGAYVTSGISFSCLDRRLTEPCPLCRRSLPAHCLRRRVLGLKGADGAFAEYVAVPAGAAVRLPADLSTWAAVLAEPLAAAMRVFEVSPVEPGAAVCVLGVGRLGLLVCRMARSHGARVLAATRSEARRVLAERFGADASFDAGAPDLADRIREATEGIGADLVVECTGAPEGLARAIALVRPRGTVVVKTTCGAAAEDLDVTDLVVREVSVVGSRCGPVAKAVERLKAGNLPVDDYVSGVFSLEEIATAYETSERAVKVLVEV